MADEPLADVSVEQLGTTVDALEAEGYRILRHWSGLPGVSARDAADLVDKRQRASAEGLAETAALLAAQQDWLRRRHDAYQAGYHSVVDGRGRRPGDGRLGTPTDHAEAQEAATAAMARFEAENPPEDPTIGFNPSVRYFPAPARSLLDRLGARDPHTGDEMPSAGAVVH